MKICNYTTEFLNSAFDKNVVIHFVDMKIPADLNNLMGV